MKRRGFWKPLLAVIGIGACYFNGFERTEERTIAGHVIDEPDYFRNTEHDRQKFLDRVFYAARNDPRGRMPKRIYFFYGEKLNRELELKSVAVYWMRGK